MSVLWVPRIYQMTAIDFIYTNPKSGLFLDPGLGKSSIMLAVLKLLKNINSINGTLLIAPLRVCHCVYPDEVKKWTQFNNIKLTILHGKDKVNRLTEKADIYLINPEGLPWLYQQLHTRLSAGEDSPFDCLVVDESTRFASHKLKSASGKPSRFGYLSIMLPLFKRRHIMTGTPAARSLEQLWSQMTIIDGVTKLGTNFYKFRTLHFFTESWNKYTWLLKTGSADKIHKAIAPYVLEMSAKDYLSMPDRIENFIKIDLPPKIHTLYKTLERDMFMQLDEVGITAASTAAASQKCHQMANGCLYEDLPLELTGQALQDFMKSRKILKVHTEKVDAVIDLVNELNGKPLLIAYHFKHDLQALLKALGRHTPVIGSGVSPKKTASIVRSWNKGKLPVLLGQPMSMGHGLNMQESSNNVCWFSIPFSLESYQQFNARVYRQGVTGSVTIHHIIARDTIDEMIITRLNKHDQQQQGLRYALKVYRDQPVLNNT